MLSLLRSLGCVGLVILVAESAHATLITNGSFESGPAPGASVELPTGSTALPGWTVINGAIDYVGSAWQDAATDGQRVLDLHGSSGASAGGVAQAFATTPGQRYEVRFQLARNPLSDETVELRVRAAGDSADFSFSFAGANPFFLGWSEESWDFVATSGTTTLELFSLSTPDTTGPALDNVRVVAAVPEPVGACLLIGLVASLGRRPRRASDA